MTGQWLMTYDLVLFDVDGTLVRTKSGAAVRKTPDDWTPLPGRLQAFIDLHTAGKRAALVTNQGGAAFGYFTPVEMHIQIRRLARFLGLGEGRTGEARWDACYICYTHPQGTVPALTCVDERRKPAPGMLYEAMRDTGITPPWTLMVGDRPEDEAAAHAAGCGFLWAAEYFAPYEQAGVP
jgi:D-glycero-D-manno-heptose 1,7-bisphosphate phosphatase